jgi:chromosome partitioning protein
MKTIAIINQKGGVGKTTISINLASAMASRGYRTLLIDMDPQSHCGVGLAVPEEQIEHSMFDILIGQARGEPLRISEILWKISDRFELAPSTIDLATFETQTAGQPDRENCLKNVLSSVQNDYDYVIIDCPPSVGLLTFNALRAATDVVVPVEMGYFSLHGLSKQLETLNALSQHSPERPNVMVLGSMYDIRTKMGREILGELRKHFSGRIFKTVVNFNTKLKEAASLGQPISEYDPSSKGFKDFLSLADELVGADTHVHKAEMVNTLQDRLKSISASADELLASIQEPKTSVEPNAQATLDQKLADFYGVRHHEGLVVFSALYPRAETVQIAGDFNGWKPEQTPLQKVSDNGNWMLKLPLEKGNYRYRLVVDGQWQQDPYNEATEMNPFGEFNSILSIQ